MEKVELSKVRIRLARPNESEKIVDLYKKEGPMKRVKKIRKDIQKDFREMAAGKRAILFAEKYRKVVGTVQLVYTMPDWGLADGQNCGHLHHLRVNEDYRNQGIGRKLEQELIALAKKKGFKKVSLSIDHDESYEFLKTLYLKWGYCFLKETPKTHETCFYKEI
ncbi:hypothetical protein COT65_01145 [Candidatus Shapirobacteria bacterium CG09_land_8_20_14_0_10_47_13]|uniref:N-acetyltransferase domain-containing protein n=1 Tax=Candidatus Shapirobacteria bacterium CG09_land_8_20_14_0_10_47_13 TaxID=1974481 RepID=A0A2H0WN09_9BACT|nr:MAG: hypothetical protein COT65_01145 [Candidatus Shapirobacteria bacterium CG09_land_8_20_14_0_10_47_13]